LPASAKATDSGPTTRVPGTHGASAWIDDSVQNPGMSTCGPNLDFPTPPYRLSGVVVGPLLNHAAALAALGGVVHEAPYKTPPKGPILYIKPRNTLAATGDALAIPSPFEELEIGASLGMVIGRTACRVSEGEALDHVSGYTLVADLSLPHDSFYRPSIRFKALDRSCLIGPRVVSRGRIGKPDALEIRISLDGAEAQIASTSGMIRPAARLIADVSAFMTLRPGDVLMLGVAFGAPRARAGQAFSVDAAGIGRLDGRLEAESDQMLPA
jgi:5-oxopent-3-ene-1,2,5-tricarboxylate decarboxylase / 2-hydroxyhepta-2,4-diene-1,7-dioate isomerase